MERKVKKLENCHVEVEVTVDEATWKAAQAKAFKKVASNVTVPGFRKGKAPENLVKAKVDQVKVMDEAINALLPDLYKDILDNEKIEPFSQPKVDVTKLSDKELGVKFIITTRPEITLGQYKGHKIGKEEVKVSADDVKKAIDDVLAQNATLVVKEAEAKLGDTVVMDFKGFVDGKEFEGGSATNYELELGSNAFIPGFEDQLVGHKAGDKVDVNVKFPENYTEELKGKDAKFECVVHEVKEKKFPELNDEFVKDLGIKDVDTVEKLKENKKTELTSRKEADAKRTYLDKLYDAIIKDSKISIPDEIVDNEVEKMRKDLETRINQSGLSLEQYLSIVGQKEEDFNKKLHSDAIRNISIYFASEKVAEAEKLTVDDKELEFEMSKLAEQYNMKLEDVQKALENQKEDFRYQIKMNRVEALLIKEND